MSPLFLLLPLQFYFLQISKRGLFTSKPILSLQGSKPSKSFTSNSGKKQKTRDPACPLQSDSPRTPHLVLLVPFLFLQCTRLLCLQKDPQNWAPSFESLVTRHCLMTSWYKILSPFSFFSALFFICGVHHHLRHWICAVTLARLSPTLCNPVDCGTPGSSVLHYLLEFA